ncbi:type II toxin-antitoxin system death-on-curing family toxin [Indioceanicola profundi]|uniref:type II toxin-antitoxin system death-on-curing family toxin n=1 Tax=Indioceanicola profundi TaxID=2220096 RepID=UPI000E6ADE70|nr:type II toxin-antitoxin system death-on-curing family toxin [Indioceanicola profundi]
MSSWNWIETTAALAIHERQISVHGGGTGIRDIGLLESAMARPQTLAVYGEPDVFDLAACYGWGLARNHPFVDGNKRTAFVVCLLFLSLHGFRLTAPMPERLETFLNVASGTMTEQSLAAWLRSNSVRAIG